MVSKIEILHFYLWGHNQGRGKSTNFIQFIFLFLYYRNKKNKHLNSALFHDSYFKAYLLREKKPFFSHSLSIAWVEEQK